MVNIMICGGIYEFGDDCVVEVLVKLVYYDLVEFWEFFNYVDNRI